jgi:hypothetical protein
MIDYRIKDGASLGQQGFRDRSERHLCNFVDKIIRLYVAVPHYRYISRIAAPRIASHLRHAVTAYLKVQSRSTVLDILSVMKNARVAIAK